MVLDRTPKAALARVAAVGLMAAVAAAPRAALAHMPRAVGGDVYAVTGKGLDNATLLIVRHGEKDGLGRGLSPAGEMRAVAYAHYFRHFKYDGVPITIDALVASKDSRKSERPLLTLKPLGEKAGLVIYQPSPDHEVQDLVAWLRERPPGQTTLISWHHNHIPKLVAALGADPKAYLPQGGWPDDAFDWVLVLRFGTAGKPLPAESRLIREPDKVNNKVWAAMDHPTIRPLDQKAAAVAQ